ncbi:phosphatase PAP2 family protein [Phenylobacterium sp.]|uniref:acid phosphatase n=1 Tax=Phenylobacterium sp. TaxID=1871053 RepID=UPI0028978CE7|nr:phosphatase PAP2 family protein [Phenylobacterium sp.]
MVRQAWILAVAALAASCATPGGQAPQAQAQAEPKPIPEIRPGYLAGYMPMGGAPNSLAILPPPPAAGSPAQARDDASAKAAEALRGSPRWSVATQDAELKFPAAAETFSCALGVKVSQETTPRLYVLLRRTLVDNGLSTYPTKTRYQRARPFMVNNTPMCTPQEEDELRKDGSYPSGHSAVGWGWALILAEAAPDRATEVLARGRAFTQSRVVCNVHWLSDTEEGRMMGAATVAKLHDNADFKADLEAAKAEIVAARAAGHLPTRDCAAEAAALVGG